MGLSGGSIVLASSYVVDWVAIIIIAAVGAGFSQISPRKRPFDITDRAISYPLNAETVTTSTLLLVTLIAPAAIILVGSLLIPADAGSPSSKRASLRRKLWELNTGWMGLAMAYAVAFIITNGAKEVLGKPRPNLLARCSPDIAKRLNATAGGIGDQIEEGITLYDWRICRNTGAVLDEGFRSFPSGHSSLAFAGLGYLALWLCTKMGVSIPFLAPRPQSAISRARDNSWSASGQQHAAGPRAEGAGPPAYLIIFPLIPFGGAIYIACTRYSDFWHHGFDVLISAILGSITAWLGFRWYHMPISRGGGWAWAPRNPKLSYWKRPGTLSYGAGGDREIKDVESAGQVGGQFLRDPRGTRQDTGDGSSQSYELNNYGVPPPAPTDFTELREGGAPHR